MRDLNRRTGGSGLDSASIVAEARRVFDAELSALREARGMVDESLARAVQVVLRATGKVVFTGVGKSGLVAMNLAASFRSTGTPAVFINGNEAAHGDLGVYSRGDPTVLVSKSGATRELLHMLPTLRHLDSTTIAIVGNLRSPLAEGSDIVLNAEAAREADPLNLVPTSSVTVALVLGHALLSAVMLGRGVTREQFALNHPSGLLGISLTMSAADVMHTGKALPMVRPDTPMREVIVEMSAKKLGATGVVDGSGKLCGIITDGDVRRMLQAHDDVRALTAGSIMTTRPVTVTPDTGLREALRLMEDRPGQLSALPVVNDDHGYVGLLRLHDIVRAEPLR